ncbi:hypothetical protein GCK32_021785, partial [Trichostrongylus colubriformis]
MVARKLSFMQSAPASIHTSPSPEPPRTPTSSSNYYVTVAEVKKPNMPKPYTRTGGANLISTQ